MLSGPKRKLGLSDKKKEDNATTTTTTAAAATATGTATSTTSTTTTTTTTTITSKSKSDGSSTNSNSSSSSSSSNNNKKIVSELETKIESLQKILRERDTAIAELKEKNTKQEKKIEEQTRAKIIKEKTAILDELKEKMRRQQKKDDETRARLAHADSPVTKAVLDKTLQENTELHLRMEAVMLQVQEDRKMNQELTKLTEQFRSELEACTARNAVLERELEAARSDVKKLQLVVIELRESLHLSHARSKLAAPSALTIPSPSASASASANVSPSANLRPASPLCVTPPSEAPSPIASPITSRGASPTNNTPTTATTTTRQDIANGSASSPRADVDVDNDNHAQALSSSNSDLNEEESETPPSDLCDAAAPTSMYESYDLGDLASGTTPSRAYESYDLGSLAKDLDFAPLVTSSSELELLKSLDSMSVPAQSLDFVSLAHDAQAQEDLRELESAVSPTARMDVPPPFQGNTAQYNHDFIEMFNPISDLHVNNHKGRDRRAKDLGQNLTNLFFIEEDKSSPPVFNLDGIDDNFFNTSTPPRQSSPVFPSSTYSEANSLTLPASPSSLAASLPSLGARAPSPSLSTSSSQPRANSPQVYRHSAPYAPISTDNDSPTNRRGHKSIFSLFSGGSDDSNGKSSSTDSTASKTSLFSTNSTSTSPSLSTPKYHEDLLLNYSSKADMNKTGLRRAKKVNIAAFAKGKMKAEPVQEDTHFCIYPYTKTKERALFAVFDGHAGRGAADEAAELFPKEFSAQLAANSGDTGQAFFKSFENIDNAMKEFEYLGTTATVVYLWLKNGNKYLQAANVGDSTAFLCRNGVAVRLTVDHKPSLQEEKERMRAAGIEVSDNQTRINGLAVSRALGNHFVKEQNIGMIATPYVGECIEILPTDTYLIVASDGLWDVVNSQHAMDIIRGLDSSPAANLLLSTALQSNKCNDNVTVIVVRLN